MRRIGIEIISRTVEVNRPEIDGIQAVLVTVGLCLYEERLLRDIVGAFVSSGYWFHKSSSLNGTGVNFGYEHIVPTCTNVSIP